MNNDLKIIKKKYGEQMMHLCRELFSTILNNQPGLLVAILLETFEPTHYLYDDLINNKLINIFKDYIYTIYNNLQITSNNITSLVPDPVTLMKQAGYTLYECKTEDDIQAFRKYYTKYEALCTFNGGRLNRCYVYFAIKDNALELERRDFKYPQRQDEYGTSVISIQFTRDNSHTLSIKNRYNHTVANPDATFSNDLDNIIPGLTQSFADYYGMFQSNYHNEHLEIPGYVRANDGKLYKYNYEIDNVYYCPNNIIIDNFDVEKYPQELYLVMDYYILDLVNKRFIYKDRKYDAFPSSIGRIKNININKNNSEKIVTINPQDGEDIIIILDKYNRIVSLKNHNVRVIENNFLCYNKILREISLDNVQEIADGFMFYNKTIKTISLPNVIKIGESFMCHSVLTHVSMPKVTNIGSRFMHSNYYLRVLELPSVLWIGSNFLANNIILDQIFMPEVIGIGDYFLENNKCLETVSFSKAREVGTGFCYRNQIISDIYLPSALVIGANFLYRNDTMTRIELPQVLSIGLNFMVYNSIIKTVILPNVKEIDNYFLQTNESIQEFYAPLLESNLQKQKLKSLQRKSKRKVYKLTK